ncbi:membrane protein FAM174B [Denticeps clupeoides]|uniref:Membrane protein FAM174B n=1 Tax=Denticeps clupeoides TaxID=299321 RepID=A0AAY4BME3_9TELE|nr:membrane protein FAM174B [Denticeps clupeoides]
MMARGLVISLLVAAAWEAHGEMRTLPSPATQPYPTSSPPENRTLQNATQEQAAGPRISSILKDLPTLKNIVIFICVLTTLLITCLVIRVYRSGKKIRKTRKYDIITTPAERVEMAPLNEDNEDEEDSSIFDVKYR